MEKKKPGHSQVDWVKYRKQDLEELAKFAAKLRLVGTLYRGNIGEQQDVKWNEDGSLEVLTPHTPAGR